MSLTHRVAHEAPSPKDLRDDGYQAHVAEPYGDATFDDIDAGVAAQVLAGVPAQLADLHQYPVEDRLSFDSDLDQHNPHATKTRVTAIRALAALTSMTAARRQIRRMSDASG